jgi:hypothetical protein
MCQDDGLIALRIGATQLGFTHSEVGVALMENWRLPQSIVTATKTIIANRTDCRTLLAIAVSYTQSWPLRPLPTIFAAGIHLMPCKRLRTIMSPCFNMTEEHLLQYLTRTDARTKQAALMFSANVGQLPSAADMMAKRLNC